MREIKFRAWDKKKKKRVHITQRVSLIRGLLMPDKDVELMQYTGLKDKNGKEIYEGDILKIVEENESDHGFYIDVDTLVVVKWMDCGFRLIEPKYYHNEKLGFCEICAAINDGGYLYSENHEIDIGCFSEVIGNIYENPNLLNKST